MQTAIGISAGIAQDPSPLQTSGTRDGPIPSPTTVFSSVAGTQASPIVDAETSPSGRTDPEPIRLHETRKTILRLDAFLGEWLAPLYFDLITPPPESVMMLATAKADLLRPENYQNSFPVSPLHLHSSSQGQLWSGSPRTSPTYGSLGQQDGLGKYSNPPDALTRSASMSSQYGRPSIVPPSEPGGYVAPVPNHAISLNHGVPPAFVAHARDACVKVDYQWDSMRAPLEWGDGGTLGEEWTEMHRRFRKGIQHLVDWYASSDNPTDMVTKTARWTSHKPEDSTGCAIEDDVEEDDDTEAVVILVSHGAGCNALIGGITHQPVLTDVSMASLTMAVRKPAEELAIIEPQQSGQNGNHFHHNKTAGKIPIHEYYDLQLLASVDHIRSNSQTASSPRAASTITGAGSARGRIANPFGSSLSNFVFNDNSGLSRSSSANPTVGGERRISGASASGPPRGSWASQKGGITVGSGVTSFSSKPPSSGLSRTPSIGLWSPISRDEDDDDDDDMVLNFSHERTEYKVQSTPNVALTASPTDQATPATNGDGAKENDNPSITIATSTEAEIPGSGPESVAKSELSPIGGLWEGGPRPPGEAERIRDLSATKRRWTVNEMET